MAVLIDVHGSCVSRTCFNFIDNSKIQVNHNFSRNHLVSCMMPPVNLYFEHGELVTHKSEYAERCMNLALNKKTLPMLLESESEYIVIDFFDFCQPVCGFYDSTFSSYDYTFYRTNAFKENKENIIQIDFLNIPTSLWYGYVDLYFKKIKEKFGDHIILNRLNCSNTYVSKENKLKEIPERLRHFGNSTYNQALHALEDYVIEKYCPYVVDISKYFIPDENYNPDTTPVHYEKNYHLLQSDIISRIILKQCVCGGVALRYYDTLTPLITSELLRRSISNQDFFTLYQERTLPFSTDTLLDYIFQLQNLDTITSNRNWISSLYRLYSLILQKTGGKVRPGIQRLLQNRDLWKDQNVSPLKQMVYNYLSEVNQYLHTHIPEIYQEFISNFEDGIPEKWMMLLNILSIISPDYEDVQLYLSQFYQATDDRDSIQKMIANQYEAHRGS